MADSRTSNSIKNSGATIFGRIGTMLMEFVLRTVLIKMMGIEYGGVSTLFTDVLQVLSLMELGLGNAITFALYKPLAENDYPKINSLLRFYKAAYNTIAASVFLLGLCCVPFLHLIVKNVPNIQEDIRIIFMLYVAASACSYLAVYQETLIRAGQQSRVAVRIDMMVNVGFIVIECIELMLLRNYLVYLVLRIGNPILRNLLVRREVKKRYPLVTSKGAQKLPAADRKRLLNDVGAMALYKVSGVVLTSTSSIVISTFLGTGVVGILGNFRVIANFINNLCNKVWEAVLPSVGNLAAQDGEQKQYRVFCKLSFASFLFAAFCSVSLFILLNPLMVVWFGQNFTVSTATVAAIALNTYLVLTILPFQTFRDANGLFVQGKYRPLIMSILNITLSVLLVQKLEMFGVLIATPIARILTQVWFDPYIVYKHVFRRSPAEYYRRLILQFLLAVGIAVLVMGLMTVCPVSNPLARLMIGCVLCVAVPVVVFVAVFHRNRQFQDLVAYGKRIARHIIGRKKG